MKIKINFNLILLYILILFNMSFFGIVKISSDVALIVDVLFILYVEIKYHKVNIEGNYNFKWIIWAILPLAIISSYQSYKLYGQDFMLGFRAQRNFIVIGLLYFPISKLIKLNKITKEDIEKMIYRIAIIDLIINFAFYLSKGNLTFLNKNYDYRYGTMRLRVDCCLVNLLFIITLNNYLKGINKIKNLIYTIVNLAYAMLVLKTRLLMVSYIAVLIVAFIIWKKDLAIKILTCICLLGLIPILFNTEIFQNTVDTILENDENDIRKLGKEYYREKLKTEPVLRNGIYKYFMSKCILWSRN